MKKELEQELLEDFPELFQDMYGDMYKTCMHWGCECGDGWFTLLYGLSIILDTCLKKYKAEVKDTDELPVYAQIKEKYGALRIYMNFETEEMSRAMARAEELSTKICEMCGRPGKLIKYNGWLMTRCTWCFYKGKIKRWLSDVKWKIKRYAR